MGTNRQLAAILFTDIIGYTAMMQKDEQKAVEITRHYIAFLNICEIKTEKILNGLELPVFCAFPVLQNDKRCYGNTAAIAE